MFCAFGLPTYFDIKLGGYALLIFPFTVSLGISFATYMIVQKFTQALLAFAIVAFIFYLLAFA